MKTIAKIMLAGVIVLAIVVGFTQEPVKKAEPKQEAKPLDSASYRQLKRQNVVLDSLIRAKGIKDTIK